MRKFTIAAVTALAFVGLAACGERAADKSAETQADALEAEAAATPNEAQEKALNTEADRIEQQAGNADGGMTTSNTPSTTTSGEMTTPPAPAQ